MNENTHGGHRERVRRRIVNEGLRALEPHEVIEFLLYSIRPRGDMNETAHRLIRQFGNVAGVLHASVGELTQVEGVGARTAEYLVRVGRSMDVCSRSDIEDRPEMGRYAEALAQLRDFERFEQEPSSCLMCLDMDSRLLYRRELTPSLAWGEPSVMREALADILSTRARCAIIALYGAYEIGSYDIVRARELACVLHECGVMLLDVILLNENGAQSMRRMGMIPEIESGREAKALCENYLR